MSWREGDPQQLSSQVGHDLHGHPVPAVLTQRVLLREGMSDDGDGTS